MKKCHFLIALPALLCLICAVLLVSCGGEAPRSIEKSEIVNGELVLTYTDGTTENLGQVVGANGADGATGAQGSQGADGQKGEAGADGATIGRVNLDAQGNLVITLTDGTVLDPVPFPEVGHRHAWGEWVLETPATCAEKGLEKSTCACGVFETREIAATGAHVYKNWTVTTPAGCTAKGVETGTCACGKTSTRDVAKLAHSYGTWTTTTPATCATKGEEKRTCACNAFETREIAATGAHQFTERSTDAAYVQAAPTCRSVGVYYYKCTTCTAKGTATFEGDSLGTHSFTSKTQNAAFLKSAANCEAPATYYYKCEYCAEMGTDTYTVGKVVHNFTAKVQTATYLKSAADCQSAATYYYKCSLCDDHGTTTYTVGKTAMHTMNENHVCTTCFGAYIYFGEYPQTLKAEDITITATTDSRGYYLGSDNAYYAKVTADPYGVYAFSDGSTVTEGTEYYFKVEPILWRILAQGDGTAMILCDSIIANKAFDDSYSSYSNNYAESDIRAWLNAEFYNTAFSALEQEMILTTTVDNSAISTGDISNPYACENTEDKVFLLSYAEYGKYGYSANIQTSDYSRATGVKINTTSSRYGYGSWWTRSPSTGDPPFVRYCDEGYWKEYYADHSDRGVIPALQIRLN